MANRIVQTQYESSFDTLSSSKTQNLVSPGSLIPEMGRWGEALVSFAELPQCYRCSPLLINFLPFPHLESGLAIYLMLPQVASFSWHNNYRSWGQINRDLCRSVSSFPSIVTSLCTINMGEMHNAWWLQRNNTDSIFEAHEINMRADTLHPGD